MKHWPLGRIKEQLDSQKSSNHQISAVVLAEGKAVLERLEVSLHMIAMVSHIDVLTLKRSLGLIGATHADNPWHRWLSFANDANKLPMPTRGHPNSSAILAARNKANRRAYNALTDNQLAVFESPMFFALGGYPDYSAISFSDDNSGDPSVLIPEVPKLSEADETLYRPIYNKLVNTKKVARDRELNTAAASAAKEEKRSLLSFKKIAQQLERDRQQLGMDYYIIACSNNGGVGWCREHSSPEDIVRWVGDKAQLPRVFQLYCQHGSLFEDIQAVSAKTGGLPAQQASNNQSDIDKRELGGMLNELVSSFLVNLVGSHKYKPFPRTPNPIASLKDRKMKVERAADSAMSIEDFNKGFTAMNAKTRRKWIKDLKEGKFKLLRDIEGQSSECEPQSTNQTSVSQPQSTNQTRPSETQTTNQTPPFEPQTTTQSRTSDPQATGNATHPSQPQTTNETRPSEPPTANQSRLSESDQTRLSEPQASQVTTGSGLSAEAQTIVITAGVAQATGSNREATCDVA
ncbi:uncharacterized protein MELLADRAFT_96035 [Melampsora larici-populina 98AG31]|uniref:Uncharacterized protein n=1 Tax=Melampsora larici-populina (strain 98AG31 / pathotype 3-4-7) TaxID=747676 RepID=F4SAN5_MELLP|nr:uncharacterized protein MELLADRAFT_96035 [Melampsora larici-populina 98AG31]EGF98297.1 hypothetical protein MELLADRAFT_96035 [Melampsora larici-populina 98AG31]